MPASWGAGGVVSAVAPLEHDTRAIFDDLAKLRALRVGIQPAHSIDRTWSDGAPAGAVRTTHMRQVLDLRGGFSEVFATRFSASTRRNTRKAESACLTVESGTSIALIDDFYKLFEQWTAQRARDRHIPMWLAMRLARRREPRSKYEEVADRLGSACRIWVARDGGQAVAAAISLTHRSHAVYWRGTSDRAAAGRTRANANALLQKLMIEDACASGCVDYDMGESGGVKSLIEYKGRFGAEEVAYDEYRIERLPLTALERRVSALTGTVERTLQRIAAR
ncbi:MAG: GNAT family N-acetyltransferase [Acidobacteria bacterium]|nr:GNAT family N-acetyltransferase [Acidobacteriota bacterium]